MRRLAALAVLLFALATMSCSSSGGKTVAAEFANVGDLVTRANVQQSDAVVGSVQAIKLVDRGGQWIARVEMTLDDDTQVNAKTRAIVRSTSLLGEKYVDLVPEGEGAPLEGGTIPLARTDKAPELEDVFSQLGAILASGGLEDLARLSTAGAMILEGQEDNVGRVIDQTAKLVASLRSQREALASALADLASASGTLAGGNDVIAKALEVGDDALRIVADQRNELEQLVIQLDRLGGPLGELTREHQQDVDAQVRAVRKIVPKLFEARDTLEDAVAKLPDFTKLFAAAAPGDYFQLNALVQALPIGSEPAASSESLADLLLAVTR